MDIFLDTPGQIEVFTWSAGGQIIHEALASTFPTVILYVTDTVRSESPTTFMSNMLYACSVLYKSRLPMVCVFNKIDVVSCDFAEEWITDFEAFQLVSAVQCCAVTSSAMCYDITMTSLLLIVSYVLTNRLK